MARIVDNSQDVDPVLAEAIVGGAPRARSNAKVQARTARKRQDKFFVPPNLIPKGWAVEWKRRSTYGKPEEPDYYMDLADGGWKYADPKIYHSLVPADYQGATIERGGMVLMTRPLHLSKESMRLDRLEAADQVRDKLSEIGMTGQGEMKRVVSNFSRGYEGAPAGRMVPGDDGEFSGENSDENE